MSSKCTERTVLKEKCFCCLLSYFLPSRIEHNGLKWKPTLPREQRGSIIDCHQEKDFNDFKRTFNITSSDTVAIKCSTPNLPSSVLSRFEWWVWVPENLPFPSFYCYNLNKKEKFKLSELSDFFTWKELYIYGICMCFDRLIFMLLSLDSVTYCILESIEKFVTIISKKH